MIAGFDKVRSTALLASARVGSGISWINDSIAQRALRGKQESFIFPKAKNVEEIKKPDEYPQLQGRGVEEKQIISQKNGNIPVYIWEKKAEPGKPHYLLFHGQMGHWGDVGDLSNQYKGTAAYQMKDPLGQALENEKHKRMRLDFLKGLADSGAGFTAVMLRGDGKTSGKPAEKAFDEDIAVAIDHVLKTVSNRNVIVGGESLGAACALKAAVQMTEMGNPPAQIDLANPFTSIARVGAENNEALSRKYHKYHLRIRFTEDEIDRDILRHHFRNDMEMEKLTPATRVHIATSLQDTTVNPQHSNDLAKIAEGKGIEVSRTYFDHSNHVNWPADQFIKDSLAFFETKKPVEEPPRKEGWALRVTHDGTTIHTH